MLTRRHIRVKVMQALYVWVHDPGTELERHEKFLRDSMAQAHNLYLLMLGLFVELRNLAADIAGKQEKSHLAPDRVSGSNFIKNKFLLRLAANKPLAKLVENHGLTDRWKEDREVVRALYDKLIQSELYQSYAALPETDLRTDMDFVADLYKEIIAPDDSLYEYLEEKQLTWADDFPVVNTSVIKMLEQVQPGEKDGWIAFLNYRNEDDDAFALELFRKTALHNEKLADELTGHTPNWDKDRIAELDLIIIKMGLAEFLYFPTIPVRATINEYLEIAKEYSTPKSSLFINGLLDNKVKEFETQNRLDKTGRGLM